MIYNTFDNIKKLINEEDKVHYYASSFANWSTHSNLAICLERQKSADRPLTKKINGKLHFPPVDVFLIPHPAKTPYEISNYVPVDVDAQLIAKFHNEEWFTE